MKEIYFQLLIRVQLGQKELLGELFKIKKKEKRRQKTQTSTDI